ncbi:YhjD/YihY/BrkB family envelope integrity protein [Tessaracoccus massiliensis]|uniref:YhjD/YihY/BrkB family envelope integrity protein n=1 Tax=Tessaracoccus massiliensis TaxID=1522311 RepID=UPI00058D673F|nr:YhjD/YihY/BrkB family envelope integrity protein [Tessaracoccus massiliensis]
MKDWIARVIERPFVAHALAAIDRYNTRLGPQFAAAITYFTVLSMVPILMFAFGSLGLTLTVLRPDLMDQITSFIIDFLGDEGIGESIGKAIEQALSDWRSVFTVALITAVYSGPNWVGNLKRAVRVMWADRFSDATERKHFLLDLVTNFAIFLGVLLTLGFGVAVAQIGHGLSQQAIDWLGWGSFPGIGFFWRLVTFVLTFVASWILMAFLFAVLPRKVVSPRAWLTGTLVGAVLVAVLQSVGGLVTGLMGRTSGANFFGPVIVMMLLFNVLATMILLTAAWVGTEDVWRAKLAQRAARERSATPAAPAAADQVEETLSSPQPVEIDDLAGALPALPEPSREEYVRQDVAARGMRANLGIGYGMGAATGLGLGALIVGLLRAIFRR